MYIRALQQFKAWKQHHSDGLKNEEPTTGLPERLERKIKKFLTDKTVYDNINKLSLMRTTKSSGKRQSSLITEQ